MSRPPTTILIGIGGASSSGKTTLAKHLRQVLPNSFILHQDDFAPPPSEIPEDPKFKVPNWEDAPHVVQWERFRNVLAHVKKTFVKTPRERDVEEEEAAQSKGPVLVSAEVYEKWKKRFSDQSKRYAIVEGFLAFWHKEVDDLYDVRLFMRTDYEVIKARRQGRGAYATTPEKPVSSAEAHGHTAKEGDRDFWVDPPFYMEKIVWPHYKLHNAPLFVDGDVENGESARPDMRVIEGDNVEQLLEEACSYIEATLGSHGRGV